MNIFTFIRFWQEVKNISLEDCRANCTEVEGGRILDPKMLELCGREMTKQEMQEVEKYRLVVVLKFSICMTWNEPETSHDKPLYLKMFVCQREK